MPDRRIVITGVGTVNAAAANAAEFLHALRVGLSGIGPIGVFDTTDYRTHCGGEVRGFDARAALPAGASRKRVSRSDAMALAAAREALNDARLLPLSAAQRQCCGVVIGGGAGGMLEAEAAFRNYLQRGPAHTEFSAFSAFCCASSADHIATAYGLLGPKSTIMTACSSSATAIGYGCDLIRGGEASMVLAGGAEPLSRITYASFNALQAVDPEPCRPFDLRRRGMNLGEGAAVLVLEALEHARQRGARVLAELLGYGVSCDAHHMTSPDPSGAGAVRCMRAALADAGVAPEQVDYINAHGTATPANDVMETKAIHALFGRRAHQIPVSSTKAITGHTLGAAGAIEAVVAVLALAHGFVPPTVRCAQPDPQCDLDYVTGGSRPAELNIALSNSFAFGGNNAAVLLGRFSEQGIVNG